MRSMDKTQRIIDTRSRNLVLTGLMGTGKTTIGRLVAHKLKRQFIDTDQYLEQKFGPASDILNRSDGDQQFRKIEEIIAVELTSKAQVVIAAGGRFMINQTNIDVMNANSDVVCLVAKLDDIVNRLLESHADTYRPRFDKALNKLALMEELELQSEPYLSQFKQIQTSGSTPTQVTEQIANWYRSAS